MPTYIFSHQDPVHAIIENNGRFGPELQHKCAAICEMINVFAGVEWAIFTHGNRQQIANAMDGNPFVSEYEFVYSEEGPTAAVSCLAVVIAVRDSVLATLAAKFGVDAGTLTYIQEAEHQDGFRHWIVNYTDGGGFNRRALVDDYQLWLKEWNPPGKEV